MRSVPIIPSAKRLMGSLRDLGYELPQAVAELVDNSIDAGATEVTITLHFEGADSWIRVADNGTGMTPRGLDEAMRYGSSVGYRRGALGGFGLGLKTASLSQCRRLTVASRRTPRARPEVRSWDLDEVGGHDEWLLLRLLPSEAHPALLEPMRAGRGTVVLWEGLDRILLYQNPWGARAENAMAALRAELGRHLSMVFHRFLAGEVPGRTRLSITLDGHCLDAWDPFARTEEATQALPVHTLELAVGRRRHRLVARPYLLPSQQRFSSPEAHQEAGGPKKWNRQQGFYIYREGRLIQSGGWNRLRTQDEHTKLARIALDIPREADEVFGVNVSKMRVTLPDAVRPSLRALVAGVAARAQDRYRTHPNGRRTSRTGHQSNGGTEHDPSLEHLVDMHAEFVPRVRVVQILRAELSDQPALLRRLVSSVLADQWGGSNRTSAPTNGGRSAEVDAPAVSPFGPLSGNER